MFLTYMLAKASCQVVSCIDIVSNDNNKNQGVPKPSNPEHLMNSIEVKTCSRLEN